MIVKVTVALSDKEVNNKKLSDSVSYNSDKDPLDIFLKKIENTIKENITKFENIA